MMRLASNLIPSILYFLVILGVTLALVYSVHISFWLTDLLRGYGMFFFWVSLGSGM